jgi:hypothetical protein
VDERGQGVAHTPFEGIEGAYDYVRLLREAIEEARQSILDDLAEADQDDEDRRRVDALRLVEYKLIQLHTHIASSSRLLNDLRTLRRLLLQERLDG